MKYPNDIDLGPTRISYVRALLVTLISMGVTLMSTSIALLLSPLRDPLAEHELVVHSYVLAVILPIIIAFPTTVYFQRERQRLRAALDLLTAAHAELAYRARMDSLTDTLNRETFLAEISSLRAEGTRGAMLMIDVDHFKTINDSFGHQAGDKALKLVSEGILRSVRREDRVGRLGGEEFGVFIAGGEQDLAKEIAERIRLEISRIRFQPQPETLRRITASIGLAMDEGTGTLNSLLNRADRFMYDAKKSGRDCVVWDQVA